jgi:uncharacterized protein YggT (Ycf19 family)
MARVRKETTVTDIPDQNVVYTTQDEVHPYSTLFQILNLILGFISGVLLLRFILLMTGANPAAGFVQLIYQVSSIFMAPFRFIFPSTAAGGSVFDWSILVAIAGYYLLFYLLKQLVIVLYTADTAN